MTRVRVFAALLGCLSVLAAGVANVAAAKDSPWVATERDTASVPCSHCDDCNNVPCPLPMTDCIQVHSASASIVLATFIELPRGSTAIERWTASPRTLSGLSPPPDPLPPRA